MEKYKLVGIMNLFNIVPDFVRPIFENDNKLYFQISNEKTAIITEFVPVKENAINNVILLNTITNNLKKREDLTISNNPLFAFQTSEEYVFIGTFEEMRDFFKSFKADNQILSDEIRDFLNNKS